MSVSKKSKQESDKFDDDFMEKRYSIIAKGAAIIDPSCRNDDDDDDDDDEFGDDEEPEEFPESYPDEDL